MLIGMGRANSCFQQIGAFYIKLLEALDNSIPAKWIPDEFCAHPLLNNECRRTLGEKHAATGTAFFIDKRDACTETFRVAHRYYIAQTK